MSRLDYISFVGQDIVTNIFTRLPVKTIGQCKCVSKAWASRLSNPDFIETHLATTSVTKLCFFSRGSLYSIDFDSNNPDSNGFLSKLNFNLSNSWTTAIWGSCNGLILVEGEEKNNIKNMFLLNPTTLEFKNIPSVPKSLKWYVYVLGYDSSCDDYAVFAVPSLYRGPVYVYMLKTNYWNEVGLCPNDHMLATFKGNFFFNGSLHWLSSQLIVAYNIANREYSELPKPYGLSDLPLFFPTLGVLKGCLCLIPRPRGVTGTAQFWVMKEYGVAESWIKLSIVVTQIRVPSLRLEENILVVLKCGQVVLLVPNTEETEFSACRPKVRVHYWMTSVNSLVSPK